LNNPVTRQESPGLVLVTDGAGFIGSHLVDRLLGLGHAVRVIDDFSTGREANLAHLTREPKLEVLRGSVLDEGLVAGAMRGVERVFHLAAAVGVKHVVEDPLWTIRTNARGTEIVLEKAFAQGARVLFASTSEIYGISEALPFREDGPRVLGPTWVHRWGYSTSKALDEHLCFAYAQHGLEVSIVRYFNIFGRRMDPAGYGSVIARFVSQALAGEPLTIHGDGRQTRCFTYIDEAVEATILAGTQPAALGQVFNVGSPFEHDIESLARLIVEQSGSSSELVRIPYEQAYGKDFADTRRRVPAVDRIAAVLGWRAQISLAEGLSQVLAERDKTGGA
jgi:UDP-glucose 4-epimerase